VVCFALLFGRKSREKVQNGAAVELKGRKKGRKTYGCNKDCNFAENFWS